MMTYIELPTNQEHHFSWKLILGFAVIFVLAAIFYFSNFAQAAVIYSNSNTYTKNGPDSSYYYTAFTASFVPATSTSFIKNTYEVMGSNTGTVKVRVYINGTLVEDSTRTGLVNNTWTAFSYINSTSYYTYNLTAGTSYNLEVKYTRGNYYSSPYTVSIRNFSLNNNSSDSTGPIFTLSTGQSGFGPYTVPPTRENIGPIYVNYFTASVVGSDAGSGINQMYACAASGNVSCYPSTVISGTNFSTQVAYNEGSAGKGVCYRAKDNSGNWTPTNGGTGGYLCTYFLRGLAAPSNVTGSVPGYGVVNVSFMDNSMEYSGGGYDERFYVYRQVNGGEWLIANPSAPIVSPNASTGPVSWTDGSVPASACNGYVSYKAIAIVSASFTSPESAPSSAISINAGGGFSCPLPAPSQCSAVAYSGPTRVKLDWYDNHNGNEGFSIYRDNNDNNFNTFLTTVNGPSGTGQVTYTNYSPPASLHKYRIWIHEPGCANCNVNYCDTNIVQALQVAPRVLTLTANKTFTNSNVTISYTAQANSGASISRYEVWRASRAQNGTIGTWSNITGGSYTQTSYTDTPPSASDWLYGLHVIDNNGNCITESGAHCGGIASDSLDPRAVVQLVVVKKDTTPPNIYPLIPPAGTYSCSATNPLSVFSFSIDTGWPQSPPTIVHYATGIGTPNCSSSTTPPQVTTTNTTVRAVGCDWAGNVTTPPISGVYNCDTAAPVITFSSSSTPPQYGWTSGNISVPITLTDSDRVSFGRYMWCPPGQSTCDPGTSLANSAPFACSGASATCSATVTYSIDGASYLCVRARDLVGNWSNAQCSGYYGKDSVIPTVTSVVGPTITNDLTPSATVYYNDALSGWSGVTVDFFDVENGLCGSASVSTNPATITMPSACYTGGGTGGETWNNFWTNPFVWLWENIWPPAYAQNTGGDGTYRFAIRARDAAGNYSNIYNHTVTIDTVAPTSVTANTFGYVNPNSGNNYANVSNFTNMAFSGTCSENGTNNVQLYMYSIGNGIIIDTGKTISCTSGIWSKTGINLGAFAQGEFFVHPLLYDAAGNYIYSMRQGIKDTVVPTTPSWRVNGGTGQQYSCSPNPTSSSMQVGWNYSTDINGIMKYNIQSYGCSCSSNIGFACVAPTALGSTWSPTPVPNYNYFSSYNGDGFYAWQVGAVDNANNSGTASPVSPNCFSDHTAPTATVITQGNPTTPSPTNDTTPTAGFTLGTDPINPNSGVEPNNCYSSAYCANLYITRPNGSSCTGVCLSPEITQYTMDGCHSGNASDDGTYTFNFQTQDTAGNIGPTTPHGVLIDTVGPLFGGEITSSVDPRADGVKPARNYTVNRNGELNPDTNSNFPVLTLKCIDNTSKTGCNIINMDPMIRFDPAGSAPAQNQTCSMWEIQTGGKLRCGAYPRISSNEVSTFEVYFDNWEGVGHNGVLTVDYTQIFADNAGNNACKNTLCQPQTLTIDNAPPVINLSGSQD